MLFPTAVHPLIGAHRGASADAPENTMAAFEQGAELIEFDVHRAKDGVLVVIHDSDLKRVTGTSGLVEERTAVQLRDLDAGSWKDERWASERIPTLDQVLDHHGASVFLNVEIKVGSVHFLGSPVRWPRRCGGGNSMTGSWSPVSSGSIFRNCAAWIPP
ncbi:MAG: glycerophosphodiester phosphodiesterase [Chloroflexota bacterium]